MTYYDTLVLSGGSMKAVSLLGAVEYCRENGFLDSIKTFIGTSAGAIICYLLCLGYTPMELLVYLCSHSLLETDFDLKKMMNGGGAISFYPLQVHLETLTIRKIGRYISLGDILEKFGKTLIIPVYNYTLQKTEYLSSKTHPDIPCIVALRMTCALPFVFEPLYYMDCYYIDGAIGDNFAIDYECGEKGTVRPRRLGITIDFDRNDETLPPQTEILSYLYNIIMIPVRTLFHQKITENARLCDIIVVANDIGLLQFQVSRQDKLNMFSVGYKIAKEYFEPHVQNIDVVD